MGGAVRRFGGFIRQAADRAGGVLREAEEIGSLRRFGADVDLLAPFRSGTSSASAPAPAPAPAPTPAPTPTPPPAPEPVAATPIAEAPVPREVREQIGRTTAQSGEAEAQAIEATAAGPAEKAVAETARKGRRSTIATTPQGLMAVAPEQVRRRRSLMGGLIS
jgi:hypothetical protein